MPPSPESEPKAINLTSLDCPPMKLEISKALDKKLIGRKDVEFTIDLGKPGKTPTVAEARKLLAAKAAFDLGGTLVVKMGHITGTNLVRGVAHVYPSEEAAKKWEPNHVLTSNLDPEAKKQALEQLKKQRMEAKAARGGKK